jgi:DNA-binding Xre family transcriptional regulator
MRYENNTVKSERVRELLERAGISIGEFSKSLWGAKTHNTITYFDARPDVKVSTLVRMAEVLGCSIEDILIKSDSTSDAPTINGHYNVVNSSYVNTDVTSLKAEVKALKMLIEEKNQRIEDLKNVNAELGARLDMVLQYGQNRDH